MKIKTLLFALIAFGFASSAQTISPSWSHVAHATHSDHVTDLFVTPSGDSYVLGHIGQLPGNTNFDGLMFMKVDTNGQEQWRRYIFPSTGDWGLFAKSVTGDDAGNIYILFNENYRYSGYSSARVVIRKYDAQGEILWSNYVTPDQDGLIEAPVARQLVYKDGSLYCAGSVYENITESNSHMDGLIYRFSAADGSVTSRIVYNSEYSTDDLFRDIHVDGAGTVWAIGRSRGYAGPGGIYSHYDSLTAKFGADGTLLWEHRLNGSGNSEDWGINLTVDGAGNAYISSQLKALSVSQKQVHVQKLSPAGTVLWTHTYQGSSSEYNWDQPVEMLPDGNIVLVNSCADGIRSVKLNATTGAVIWENFYERMDTGLYNRPRHTLVDDSGNIYITGRSRDNTPMGDGYDMVTLKYSGSGDLLWESHFTYGNYDTAGDEGVKLGMDSSGNAYAIGWVQDASNNNDFALLKYGGSTLSVQGNILADTRIYPNPAVGFVNLSGGAQLTGATLYDLGGRTVRKWEIHGPDAKLDFEGLAPSLYLLQVNGASGSKTVKINKL